MKLLPNKIQLDILRKHVGPFIFCFFTVMFLLLMQFLILYIDKLIGKGLPLSVILELIITNLAYMVVLAAPMAMLVASLMAFGKFTELNEMTALRAAGVNPIHVINPVLVAAGIMSLFLIWFSNDILPNANQRARSLFLDIRTKKPGFNLKEDEFYNGINGYTFLVKEMTSESDSLHHITLFQEASSKKKGAIIKAKKGYMEGSKNETLTLYLLNGSIIRTLYNHANHKTNEVVEKTSFKRHRLTFDLSEMAFSRSNPKNHSRNDRTMNVQSMKAVVDTLKDELQTEKTKIFKKHTFEPEYKVDEVYNQINYGNRDTITPYKSSFFMLNLDSTKFQQDRLYHSTLSALRSYRSSYSNLKVNAGWRTGRIAKYWVEIYKKFSLPLACLIFVLIGAPIGIFTKRGNLGSAALIGAGFLTFFFISIIQGEKMADRQFISPFTGMWASDILLAVIGGIMLLKLCTSLKLSDLWKNRD